MGKKRKLVEQKLPDWELDLRNMRDQLINSEGPKDNKIKAMAQYAQQLVRENPKAADEIRTRGAVAVARIFAA
jgi:hypothetical protein